MKYVLLINNQLFYVQPVVELFGFQTFRPWAYLMKVIPETRRAH
jgi:hypothetical protein